MTVIVAISASHANNFALFESNSGVVLPSRKCSLPMNRRSQIALSHVSCNHAIKQPYRNHRPSN